MIKKWSVEHSHLIHRDRWIHLRADSCRRSDGLLIQPYYVLEQPEWVSILALTEDNEVILVEEYRHGAGVVTAGLPGGAINQGERPDDAAARELLEETGYVGREMIAVGIGYANWSNQDNRIHYYLALGCTATHEQTLDTNEQIEVRLVPLDQISRPGFLQQSYHVANLFFAREYLDMLTR